MTTADNLRIKGLAVVINQSCGILFDICLEDAILLDLLMIGYLVGIKINKSICTVWF